MKILFLLFPLLVLSQLKGEVEVEKEVIEDFLNLNNGENIYHYSLQLTFTNDTKNKLWYYYNNESIYESAFYKISCRGDYDEIPYSIDKCKKDLQRELNYSKKTNYYIAIDEMNLYQYSDDDPSSEWIDNMFDCNMEYVDNLAIKKGIIKKSKLPNKIHLNPKESKTFRISLIGFSYSIGATFEVATKESKNFVSKGTEYNGKVFVNGVKFKIEAPKVE